VIARTPLATSRLTLRPVEPDLADAVWEATEASLPELRPWLPWAATATPEQSRAFAEEAVRNWELGSDYNFAILSDGQVVGTIGLYTSRLNRPIGEVGYWLRTDATGRGYVTEAGHAVVRFGFEDLAVIRLELRAGVRNVPSQRVAERLGFRREGKLRKGCPHPDGGYDCYLYGLLREDLASS
jgi:ribosomal-protein-serine acetyltransferase